MNDCEPHSYREALLERAASKEWETISTPETRPVHNADEAVARALAEPIGAPELGRLVTTESRVGILIDDITRPTPVSAILPGVMHCLFTSGVRKENICFIHAPGLHMNGPDDFAARLGETFSAWEWLVDHDARHSPMAYFGMTSFGTPVWANSVVREVDLLLGIGSIRPHMDAGFSGGCKIAVPGISAKATIDRNHGLMLSPDSGIGRVDTNPVRRDLEEAGTLVGLHFVVNVLVDAKKRMTHVFAGDPILAHRAGVQRFLEVYGSPVAERADLVVAYSCAGYLSHVLQSLVRSEMCSKERAAIIVLAPDAGLWAPPGAVKRLGTFSEMYMTLSAEQLAELVVTHRVEEVRHATAAFNFRMVCEKHQVVLVTGSQHRDWALRAGMEYAVSLDDALDLIRGRSGTVGRGVLMLDAGNVYPVVA